MESMTSNANRFAIWFNMTYPDAYRRITTEDIENLKSCELIHCYGFYSTSQDGKIVMSILKYEQMLERRPSQETCDEAKPRTCKMCGRPLPIESEDKSGRPKEYCSMCESSRNRDRKKKSRHLRRKQCKPAIT